jgi:hypothetical protein
MKGSRPPRGSQGREYVAVLAATSVALAALGAGRRSIDDVPGISSDLDGVVGLALSAGLGQPGATGLLATSGGRRRRPGWIEPDDRTPQRGVALWLSKVT